eukprot:560224-Pleurochrysis_carterae.AAC.2
MCRATCTAQCGILLKPFTADFSQKKVEAGPGSVSSPPSARAPDRTHCHPRRRARHAPVRRMESLVSKRKPHPGQEVGPDAPNPLVQHCGRVVPRLQSVLASPNFFAWLDPKPPHRLPRASSKHCFYVTKRPRSVDEVLIALLDCAFPDRPFWQ